IDKLKHEGFRLDVIFPADEPNTALLSRQGETVHLRVAGAQALPRDLPPFQPGYVLTRAGASSAKGRAGMLYRDLIPGRLGGRYIASHIAIPEGGPVADWVHYHRIALQLIYVRRGWVRVVYEDQGEPFVMSEGDLVLQPPGIRHRVLESSPGLEVIEIGAPALHETFADHELSLPNGERPGRTLSGQRFLHHVASETPWTLFKGAEAQETRMAEATAGIADVRTIRPGGSDRIGFPPHEGELVFGFAIDGAALLDGRSLGAGDAFAMRPGQSWTLSDMTDDFRLLHVTTACLDAAA